MKIKKRTGFAVLGIFFGSWFCMTSCSINTDPYFSQQLLEPFDTLALNSVLNVHLIQGDHYGMEINGAQEIAASVTYHMKGHTLVIENDNGPLWRHPSLEPPILTITFVKMQRLRVDQTCHVICDNTITVDTFGLLLGSKLNFADLKLQCHLFYYWNTASVGGQLNLSGHTDFMRLYNGSLLGIDASQLTAHDVLVVNGSKRDIQVYTDQSLYYSITGTGNIYLTGNPWDIEMGPITSTGLLIQ